MQRELNEKTILQDEQMQRVKEKSLETVKDHVRQALRPRVNGIVAECVKREIENRVHHEASICASCLSRPGAHLTCVAHGTNP